MRRRATGAREIRRGLGGLEGEGERVRRMKEGEVDHELNNEKLRDSFKKLSMT